MAALADPLFDSLVVGSGSEKLIAIHGWMAGSSLFAPLHEHLDAASWSVGFMDCRGYGARKAVPGALSAEEIAADALRLADHLGWDTFHVLGHSMAGMAAQRLMVDAEGRLRSALLLSPVAAGGARIDDARRELLISATVDPEVRLRLIDANTGSVRERAWLEHLRDLSVADTVQGAMLAYLASWTGAGFAEELRGSRCRATVVIGELDPGTPLEAVRKTFGGLLVNVRYEVLEGVGHYAMREDPRALSQVLDRHLRQSQDV